MTDVALYQIQVLGETLDDLEQVRIGLSHRIKAATRRALEPMPHLLDVMGRVAAIEHLAELELKRAWRKHPLASWGKSVPGLGEKQFARLIVEIGTPNLRAVGHFEQNGDNGDRTRHFVIDSWEPRTVGQLWAYCGHGDPVRKRREGMTQLEALALGNPRAKMRTRLIAKSLMERRCANCRAANPTENGWAPPSQDCSCAEEGLSYRVIYNMRRIATADKTHEKACAQCGPSGHPAQPGSAWSDGHRHGDALRIVGKHFLAELWEAAGGSTVPRDPITGRPPAVNQNVSRQKVVDAHTMNAGDNA
jgi:hypothetical protein